MRHRKRRAVPPPVSVGQRPLPCDHEDGGVIAGECAARAGSSVTLTVNSGGGGGRGVGSGAAGQRAWCRFSAAGGGGGIWCQQSGIQVAASRWPAWRWATPEEPTRALMVGIDLQGDAASPGLAYRRHAAAGAMARCACASVRMSASTGASAAALAKSVTGAVGSCRCVGRPGGSSSTQPSGCCGQYANAVCSQRWLASSVCGLAVSPDRAPAKPRKAYSSPSESRRWVPDTSATLQGVRHSGRGGQRTISPAASEIAMSGHHHSCPSSLATYRAGCVVARWRTPRLRHPARPALAGPLAARLRSKRVCTARPASVAQVVLIRRRVCPAASAPVLTAQLQRDQCVESAATGSAHHAAHRWVSAEAAFGGVAGTAAARHRPSAGRFVHAWPPTTAARRDDTQGFAVIPRGSDAATGVRKSASFFGLDLAGLRQYSPR